MKVTAERFMYFKNSEFLNCEPVCTIYDMDDVFMEMLDLARLIAGIPFIINSAFRTVKHERERGRSGLSSHTKGKAIDIHCLESDDRMIIVDALIKAGFKRIGISENFIHVDNDSDKHTAMWLY